MRESEENGNIAVGMYVLAVVCWWIIQILGVTFFFK